MEKIITESTNTKIIEGNTLVFEFNGPNEIDGGVIGDFDFRMKPVKVTQWIMKLIQLSEFEMLSSPLVFDLVKENLKRKVIREILSAVQTKSTEQELSYTQKFSFNGTDCVVIDNGEDICFMLPGEHRSIWIECPIHFE